MTTGSYPRRIVCLTEETTETLYLLGEGDRVAGVSGYTVRPPEARRKPRVSAFTHARYEKIEALEPDLVLGFSDLQGDIAADLAKRGYPVMLFNQRSVAEILQMILIVGGLVGRADRAAALVAELEAGLDAVRARRGATAGAAARLLRGMGRAADLRHPLGGRARRDRRRRADLSRAPRREAGQGPHRGRRRGGAPRAGRDRRVVVRQGGAARAHPVRDRDGISVPAVRRGHIYEIKSALILQPGPAALTDGLRQLHDAVTAASAYTA